MTDNVVNARWPREATYTRETTSASLALELVERNSRLKSRNITIDGRRTSVRLEPAMWDALKDIAAWEKKSINEVLTSVARSRVSSGSLTSAIRIFVMAYFRARWQAQDDAA